MMNRWFNNEYLKQRKINRAHDKLLRYKERFAKQACKMYGKQQMSTSRFREVLGLNYISEATGYYREHKRSGMSLEDYQNEQTFKAYTGRTNG